MKKAIKTERALKAFVNQIGYWPSQNEWDQYARENGYLTVVALRHYTKMSWEAYRKKLGFPPRVRHFTREECIKALQVAAQELGMFFTQKDYAAWRNNNRPDLPTLSQIQRQCRRWNDAKTMAGLVPNPVFATRITTERDVLNALKECASELGPEFGERQYVKWRESKGKIHPNVETIRKIMNGFPNAKKLLGLHSYKQGGVEKYTDPVSWQEPLLQFIGKQLSCEKYERWAEANSGPSLKALRENAGGSYDAALLQALELYLQKIKAGRKKRYTY
jgi:hypothetical protein